jgi:hypothetical protein
MSKRRPLGPRGPNTGRWKRGEYDMTGTKARLAQQAAEAAALSGHLRRFAMLPAPEVESSQSSQEDVCPS